VKIEDTNSRGTFFSKQIKENPSVVEYFKKNYLEKETNLKFSDLGKIINSKENKGI
jgi:hypothetical protein